jgi:hypothetical protein
MRRHFIYAGSFRTACSMQTDRNNHFHQTCRTLVLSKISANKPIESRGKADGKHAHSGKATANGGRKSEARSRVTNGQDVLPGVDNRSMRGRRYYDIQTAITNDQGGAEHLPEVKLQLIRRFSGTSVIAEEMEAQYVRGEQINIQDYALECSTLVRLARQIGVNRIARDVTPTLDLAQRNGAAE